MVTTFIWGWDESLFHYFVINSNFDSNQSLFSFTSLKIYHGTICLYQFFFVKIRQGRFLPFSDKIGIRCRY